MSNPTYCDNVDRRVAGKVKVRNVPLTVGHRPTHKSIRSAMAPSSPRCRGSEPSDGVILRISEDAHRILYPSMLTIRLTTRARKM